VRVVQLYKEGKYDEALPLAKQVLIVREKILGPDEGRTAAALLNLAELYLAKQNYSEAEKLYRRLLSLYEKTLGNDAPKTAMMVDNLALTDYLKGDFKSAESLYVRAVSMREQALGAERRDLGQAVFKLAEFYRSRRSYAKAEPLYLRAIAINDRELAKDDPVATHTIQRYKCFVYESDGVSAGQKKLRQFDEARKAMSQTPPADHGEVLNGRAISLPAPEYPGEARSIRASGVVLVQVTIDTGGKVIDAKVVCGHPVFAKPSLEAAYRARFTPTKLSGMPVQVNGMIIYNFVAQ
jgi:TonB family protein